MPQEWQGSTDGNRWMQQQLISCFRFLPLWFYYVGVACVVPFYMLFGKGYKPSYRFYRRRMGMSAVRSFGMAYRNHCRFGQVMIDRFACYAGVKFRLEREGEDVFPSLAASPDSFVMLSSHTGNYEISGYTFTMTNKMLNVLVYTGETETIMKNRQIQFERHHIRMVPVTADMGHVYAINQAFEKGDAVSMPADRSFGGGRTVDCPFFGVVAPFPLGPFATIAMRRLKAVCVFVMKEGVKRYRVFVHPLEIPDASVPNREAAKQMAAQYAALLEKIVRRYPEQWFNFFDFWQSVDSRG